MPDCRSVAPILGATALILGLLLSPNPAAAFRCQRASDAVGTETPVSVYWPQRKVTFQLNEDSARPLLKSDSLPSLIAINDTIKQALEVWSSAQLRDGISPTGCSDVLLNDASATDLQLELGEPTIQTAVGYNYLQPQRNINLIVFRQSNWGNNSIDRSIIALTHTMYDAVSGKIYDADVELNAQNFTFYVPNTFPARANATQADLLYSLAHEFGHSLGFAHSDADNPKALMFSQAPADMAAARLLTCDDLGILLLRYPAQSAVGYCGPNQSLKECGYCTLPSGLIYDANSTVLRNNNGTGGCSCAAQDARYLSLLGVWRLLTLLRRRKAA